MGRATPVMTTPKDPDLRDWFAGQALAGILAAHTGADDIALPPESRAAKWAYEYADAMLRHRQPAAEPADLEYATAEALNGRR